MSRDVAVRISGVGKRYRIGAAVHHTTLREHLTHLASTPARRLRGGRREQKPEFWALEDVSLEVHRGDVLGIVGRNGAGKSTLLKILSRITDPTAGEIEIHGRVGSLLEVGTGFHGELTGRENVFLNGAILGMRRAEIVRKFDEIVAFSGIGDFLDTPVKRYSSGMYVRLAFAVAAHLEPEILIVDEVLAVGDAAFQKKCIGKMGEVAHSGRTVLFVSHNMGAVAELCTRAVLLEKGRKVADGSVASVIEDYSRVLGGDHQAGFADDPSLPTSVIGCRLERIDGTPVSTFDIGEEVVVVVRYKTRQLARNFQLTLTLARNMVDIINTNDTDPHLELPQREPGEYEARCVFPAMFLKAGVYTLRVATGTPERLFQDFPHAISFEVEELSVNAEMKGYRRDRAGHIIAPIEWETTEVTREPQAVAS
jgi:lipopolysaccharide transport system ATP-binding protein